jgi:hypothetical protein
MYIGTVAQRDDPEGLARVKVALPGLIEPATRWAWPMASPGGGIAQRGKKRVPKLGAEVCVLFVQGNPDRPVYLPANWGKPGGVTEIPGSNVDPDTLDGENGEPNEGTLDPLSAEDAPDVHVEETENYLIVVDEREGKDRMFVRHKKTGDFAEYDGIGSGWVLRASTGVFINCDGVFSVNANQIQLNGRIVQATDNPL